MASNKKPAAKKGIGAAALLAVGAICLVAGLLVGKFVIGAPTAHNPLNKVTLTAGELDTVVGTYTYAGETHEITARAVIEDSSSLATAAKEDGTYDVPTADAILGFARNSIIMREAESRGITVTDEDVAAYAREVLGTDDYATIAATYGLTEEVAKRMLSESAVMKKLRDQVISDSGVGEAPVPPTQPEDGNHDATSKEWADLLATSGMPRTTRGPALTAPITPRCRPTRSPTSPPATRRPSRRTTSPTRPTPPSRTTPPRSGPTS